MKYSNPQLRNRLAAEYVLGTLRGAARARFQSLLKYDAGLRAEVAAWETKLAPLDAAARDIVPPVHVWDRIAARLAGTQAKLGWWSSLARSLVLWRGLAVAGIVAAVALGVMLRGTQVVDPPPAVIAIMNDEQARPAMVVSWPPWNTVRETRLRVRIVTPHATMADNTSWELWMLPG